MWASRLVPYLSRGASCLLQRQGKILKGRVPQTFPITCFSEQQGLKNYSTAADNTPPPRWVQLEPELEEVLVPRKLSVSPLESWLSMRYSLPPLLEAPQPQEDVDLLEEKVLPPIAVPVLEDEIGSSTPLQCKNVLEIRRRKINGHKYRKLQKRIRFLKRRVLHGRAKKKQKKFEKEVTRIWKRAGLKSTEGLKIPNIYVKYSTRRE